MVAQFRQNHRLAMKLATALLFALLFTPFASSHASENSRPNIILIMVDDFGYECITANGGQSYQTPNIDKLAATGVRFENCHVQPLCTPTRVQLMTGKYNVRNYLRFGTLVRTETTFGHLFRNAGYTTGICGKWQLGHEVDSPQHFGFEESCLWQQTRRPPRYANPGLEYNSVEKDFTNGEYGPTLVNDFALDFITRHREKPFFLYYPMILTHSPFQPTPDSSDWDPKTRTEKELQDVKHFADMTAYTDKMVAYYRDALPRGRNPDNTTPHSSSPATCPNSAAPYPSPPPPTAPPPPYYRFHLLPPLPARPREWLHGHGSSSRQRPNASIGNLNFTVRVNSSI